MRQRLTILAATVLFVVTALCVAAQEQPPQQSQKPPQPAPPQHQQQPPQAQPPAQQYALKYAPQAGQKWQETITGNLLDAALQGESLGLQGNASSDISAQVKTVDADKKTATQQFDFTDVKATLNGEDTTPDAPAAICMTFDQTGQVVAFEDDDDQGQGVNFMDTGGIPLPVLAVMSHVIRFPDKPVAVGDEWNCKDDYALPGIGDVPINTHWKLIGVKDGVATIGSRAAAVLPDFKTPNPMAPGTAMEVTGGQAYLTELKQKYEIKNSRLLSSDGQLRIEANLNLQGQELPVVLTIKFSMQPEAKGAATAAVAKPKPPAATTPAAPPAQAQPAAPPQAPAEPAPPAR